MTPSSPTSDIRRPFDQTGSSHSEISNQSYTTIYGNDSQTSPLDLSITSIRFPAIRRTTAPDDPMSSSTDLSINSNNNIYSRQISIDCSYDKPTILTPPKSEWHYRSKRDLAKEHIPFLPGDGPQRTPIRLKIPEKSDQQMYLGITVVTHDGQFHDSKVIVPAKTKVNVNCPSHDNNLNSLQFDECNSTDRFDPVTRSVYLKITQEEHKAELKEVRVHMFNLYQNQIITKEIIEAKQLHLCRLAFWFCFFDNKHYIPISQCSFSSIIREKKTSTRSNVLQQIATNNNINSVNPYSMASAEYDNQDDDDDDDDDHFSAFSINE